MNIKLIARYIGVALLFNAAFMFLSVIVSMINGFDSSFSPLLLSCLITTTVGCFPLIFVRKKEDVGLKEGYAITFFSWVLSFVFGMLPYVLWGDPFTLPNAWFESVSGYTTTGSTILTDIEMLPKGLLFWRYSTHYIGGIGVMIFMLMVLPAVSAFTLRKIEISTLSKDNYKYKTKQTLKVIASMYLGITFLSATSLFLAG
ncbi:MAG: TrkH family potassium uptake protein, partial [Bacteroidales bacterium]|nr:TrkH family potassium uptake protein [Bacteroidales bacterium]